MQAAVVEIFNIQEMVVALTVAAQAAQAVAAMVEDLTHLFKVLDMMELTVLAVAVVGIDMTLHTQQVGMVTAVLVL